MLTLTYVPETGDQVQIVLGDGATGLAVNRVQIPRARRVKVTPTRNGASVVSGAMDVRPITVTGTVVAQKTRGRFAAPLRLDDLETIEGWMVNDRLVGVTYRRAAWTSASAYTMPVQDLGNHYVTEVDPTYQEFRLGVPARVDWRVVLTPVATRGRAV